MTERDVLRRTVRMLSTGALLLGGLHGAARADESESILLEYSSPEECPKREFILGEVTGRTSRVHVAESGIGLRVFRLVIERRDSAFQAVLTIRDEAGATSKRELGGTVCEDVAVSMALSIALAVDPNARVERVQPAAVLAPPEPIRVSEPVVPVVSQPSRSPVVEKPTANRTGLEAQWRGALGAQVSVLVGQAPDASLGLGIQGAIEHPRWYGMRPVVRAALLAYDSRVMEAVDVGGSFRWIGLRSEVCPSALGERFRLSACGAIDLGALEVEGRRGATTSSDTRFWGAWGGTIHGMWQSERRESFDLGIGVMVPMRRDTYVIDSPRESVHEMPGWIGLASLTGSWSIF